MKYAYRGSNSNHITTIESVCSGMKCKHNQLFKIETHSEPFVGESLVAVSRKTRFLTSFARKLWTGDGSQVFIDVLPSYKHTVTTYIGSF